MTDLVVRKIAWEFDASVPFLWQPANPNFGIFCNAFTFIAVPFEKYIISSLRQAQDRLAENPDVAAEAEAFLRQEAQHAAAHRKHMLALIERYPALEQCYQDTVESYDDLIKSRARRVSCGVHRQPGGDLHAVVQGLPRQSRRIVRRRRPAGGVTDGVALRGGDRAPQFRV